MILLYDVEKEEFYVVCPKDGDKYVIVFKI